MRFIFDMDGTLVDSMRAVKEAYRQAGADWKPEYWGLTAREWGCPPEVHEMKKRLYPTALRRLGRRLHAANLLEVVQGEILTGASLEAVHAVLEVLDLDAPILAAGAAQDTKQGHTPSKIDILRDAASDQRVFYVDDDRDFGLRVLREVPNTYFLHVAEHEGVFHLHNEKGEVQRWTLSSWLPDVTIA